MSGRTCQQKKEAYTIGQKQISTHINTRSALKQLQQLTLQLEERI